MLGIPPDFTVSFKLFLSQVVNRYAFLILCTGKKLKYNRNFKVQDEINSACIKWLSQLSLYKMAITRDKYGHVVVQISLQKKNLEQRFSNPVNST